MNQAPGMTSPLTHFCAQLRPAFCNPMDCSLLVSAAHEIFQERVLVGFPFPSPGHLPSSGINSESLASPALQADSLLLSRTREDPLIMKSMLIKSTLTNPLPPVRTAIVRTLSKE